MSFCPLLGKLSLLTLVIKTLGSFFTACMSHNTDTSILKISGCWTLNKICLFHLNLKFVSVHLFPLSLLFDCLQITVLSLMQSRLKTYVPRIYLGKHLSMSRKGLAERYHLMYLRFFQGPKSLPLGYISRRDTRFQDFTKYPCLMVI